MNIEAPAENGYARFHQVTRKEGVKARGSKPEEYEITLRFVHVGVRMAQVWRIMNGARLRREWA